ncbi:hypothetical protein E4U30_008351 [Claviceps sp. LM220 group G6]|nr:hypothetical protein E4U30_008351 [Claviceps sp. LM220 group G6]
MPLNGSLETSSLYISLNARSHAGSYHWGLFLTDSDLNKKPALHHANNRIGPWTYEEKAVDPDESVTLIVLFFVSKVKNHARAVEIMKGIPADGKPSQRTGEPFSCVTWAKDALVLLHESGEIVLPQTIDKLEVAAVEKGLRYAHKAEGGGGATVITENS